MSFCITSFFRGCSRPTYVHPGYEISPCTRREKELEDLRKFSLNLLMMFLGIHIIAGSKELRPLINALLVYTISLHLTVSASFLQNCPILSGFLHSVPFLGICCMAIFALVEDAQSPAARAGGLLVAGLPMLVIAVYHARLRAEKASMCLPVRMCEVPHRT